MLWWALLVLVGPLVALGSPVATQFKVLSTASDGSVSRAVRSPVILFPGTGGTQLEANLTGKPTTVSRLCDKRTKDYFRIWLAVSSLLPVPGAVECWADNLKVQYDPVRDFSTPMPGVDTRVPGQFEGSTRAIEYLDPSLKIGPSSYFHDFVKALKEQGYEEFKDLFGAAYDFRFSPARSPAPHVTEYIDLVRRLIERAYMNSGGKKVVLVAHSLGCLYISYILSISDSNWVASRVSRLIAIGGPWAGAPKVVRVHLTGDNEDVTFVNPRKLRDMQRTFESNHWLMPVDTVTRGSPLDRFVTVGTGERAVNFGFGADQVRELFDRANFTVGRAMLDRVRGHRALDVPFHKVRTVFINAEGKDTATAFTYPDGDFSKEPISEFSDGDATVPRESLDAARRVWTSQGFGDYLKSEWVTGVEHMVMPRDKRIIARVIELLRESDAEV